MKVVKITIGGKEQHLFFNGAAMFEINEKHKDIATFLKKLMEETKESFVLVCETVAVLAENGELARRFMGHTPNDIIDAATLRQIVQPIDLAKIKTAIPQAIALGLGREIEPDDDEEIDVVLLELNQKKTK